MLTRMQVINPTISTLTWILSKLLVSLISYTSLKDMSLYPFSLRVTFTLRCWVILINFKQSLNLPAEIYFINISIGSSNVQIYLLQKHEVLAIVSLMKWYLKAIWLVLQWYPWLSPTLYFNCHNGRVVESCCILRSLDKPFNHIDSYIASLVSYTLLLS